MAVTATEEGYVDGVGGFRLKVFNAVVSGGSTNATFETGFDEVIAAFANNSTSDDLVQIILNSNNGTADSKGGHIYCDKFTADDTFQVVVFGR